MSSVLVTARGETDWLDPLRWGMLARVATEPGIRVGPLAGDSLVSERALQGMVDADWMTYRDDTSWRPLAGPNVYLTPVGEEAVASGRAWIRSVGTPKGVPGTADERPRTERLRKRTKTGGNRAAWRGASGGMSASSFDPRELRLGERSEAREHGLPRSTARRIAMDHLVEDPSYYSRNRAAYAAPPPPLARVLAGTGVAPRQRRTVAPAGRRPVEGRPRVSTGRGRAGHHPRPRRPRPRRPEGRRWRADRRRVARREARDRARGQDGPRRAPRVQDGAVVPRGRVEERGRTRRHGRSDRLRARAGARRRSLCVPEEREGSSRPSPRADPGAARTRRRRGSTSRFVEEEHGEGAICGEGEDEESTYGGGAHGRDRKTRRRTPRSPSEEGGDRSMRLRLLRPSDRPRRTTRVPLGSKDRET